LTRVLAVLACLALSACFVRGEGERSTKAKEREAKLAAAVEETDPWLRGELPPEVNEDTPKRGGTLVVRMYSEPPSLNKITDSDYATTLMLDRKVYESLAELDADRHPDYPLKPLLAESWSVSEDGLTFTFKVRRGVRWHDGRPFSGKDVVATIEKILDPKVRAMHLRNQFELLESVRTAPGDDFTVVANYREPYFLALRSLATLPIYPKHLLDEAGDMLKHPIHRAPVGTGPFRFEQWITADRITFVRHEDYWGRKAWLDRIVYRLVENPTVAFQLLQQGQFDLYLMLQPAQWVKEMPKVESLRENYHRVRFFHPNYAWIGWNTRRPFFADRNVRLAMTYLMDREGMRRSFLYGLDRPTTCHFYSESSSCDPSLEPRPYDPELAVRLLDESGWVDSDGDGIRDRDGVPFRFTFLITSSSVFLGKLAPYLQQELRKVGIAMDIKRVEWALFTQMLREQEFDVCSLLWGNTDVVSDPFQIWHSSQAASGSNYISYANPELDRLIEEARRELDDERRSALYRRLGRILYDENPYTFLYTRPSLDAVKKNVRGLRPAVPWYDLEDVWLDDGAGAEAGR
jgi:peptide/nickel transport system substrate-binding protein